MISFFSDFLLIIWVWDIEIKFNTNVNKLIYNYKLTILVLLHLFSSMLLYLHLLSLSLPIDLCILLFHTVFHFSIHLHSYDNLLISRFRILNFNFACLHYYFDASTHIICMEFCWLWISTWAGILNRKSHLGVSPILWIANNL